MERERPSRARSAFVLTTCDLFWWINDASLRDNYCYCVPGSAKVVISGMLLLTVQFFQMGLNGVYSRGTISRGWRPNAAAAAHLRYYQTERKRVSKLDWRRARIHDLPGCACFLSPIWHITIKITRNLRRRLKSRRVWNITQPSMPGF
jgi:hypothetical protein